MPVLTGNKVSVGKNFNLTKQVYIMPEPISYIEEIKRKLIHLSSLWMVAATIVLPAISSYGRWIACALIGVCLLITLISEHDYANGGKYLGRLYGKLFSKMLRSDVKPGQWSVSGGAPVLAAALLVNLIFPCPIAAAALAVMLTGDAAAALIGRKFGKHKLVNNKSLEGTVSFVIAGYIFLALTALCNQMPLNFYIAGIFAVIAGAAVELFTEQIKLDDNFTIPLTTGAVLSITLLF